MFDATSMHSITTRIAQYEPDRASTSSRTSCAATPITISGRRRPQGVTSRSLAEPETGWTTIATTAWRPAISESAEVLIAAGTSCSTSLGRTMVVSEPQVTDRPK